ncbi:MAG: sppA 1 [Gemmataceae bacterium]|nr:sppA 1 [Gemmataceae bacterium]
MRTMLPVLMLVLLTCGCQRFTVRTQNRVALDGPVDTRITDLSPVSPIAGPVRAVVVEAGTAGRVAVIDVDGVVLNTPFVGPMSVGENPVALFREKLLAAEADPCVRAVVLRINSHGGGVAACTAMRRDLERFKARTGRPVIACLLDTATGGAYHLASAADQIVAGSTTVTGGIGVVLNLFNLQDLMAQFNVIPQPIKAGERVDIGSSARPLKPEEKQLLQAMADEFHGEQIADIRKSRPQIKPDDVSFDGRIFTASQARARGLVDQIGDMDTALQLTAQLGCAAGPGARPEVVLYRRNNDPAHSVYAVTANIPLQGAGLLPNLPGLDRTKLPSFLSMWQPELTMEKLGGK